MITHSISRRNARALPPVESTVYFGITSPIMKFVSHVSGCVGNVRVAKGETCYAVKSARRENRYYIVKWNAAYKLWQCSCGCNMSDHDHIRVVKAFVVTKVVKPQVEAIVAKAQPEMPQNHTEKVENKPVVAETTQTTAIDWKAVVKADKARQKAWRQEYWAKVKEAREQSQLEQAAS